MYCMESAGEPSSSSADAAVEVVDKAAPGADVEDDEVPSTLSSEGPSGSAAVEVSVEAPLPSGVESSFL